VPELTDNILNSEDTLSAAKRAYYRSPDGIADFLKHQLKISTKAIGMQSFIPNPVQIPILKSMVKQLKEKGVIRQIWFKCRQIGASTLASGIIWNRISLFDGMYAFVVAQDRSTSEHLYNMYDLFYANRHSDICRQKKYHTKGFEMVLGDPDEELNQNIESRLLTAEAKNLHIGTGRTLHCLHLSEICRYPTTDPIKESLMPACSDFPGTVRIIESTVHFGQGADYFRYQCERAMAGKSEYEYHFIRWWLMSEYAIPLKSGERLKLDVEERHLIKRYKLTLENIKWRRDKIEELEGDINSFHLSYPMNYEEGWITKETSAFPQDRLMELHAMLKPPIKRFRIEGKEMYEHDQGEFWVWIMPKSGKLYDIGADVGGGYKDGDWSVAELIERGSNTQCAEYRGRVLPSEFADILGVIGKFYNTAQIGPEVNSYGLETVHELNKTYPNIYLWRKEDKMVPRFTGDLGWSTQYDSKLLMVGLGHKRIYHRQVQIFSTVLWDELRYFGRDYTDTGRLTYGAVKGYDDTCMAWLIALKISDAECFGSMSQDIAPTPKVQSRDPATYDSTWKDVLNGKSNYEKITGSWAD